MSKVIQDFKNLRGAWGYGTVVFLLLFISTFLFSEYPRDLYFLNEMFMLPLVVLCTVSFFQREFGGFFSEIYATFPLSFFSMIVRKLVLLYSLIALIHFSWVMTYVAKFDKMETVLYSYVKDVGQFQEVSWLQLFLQALPAYFIFTAVTLLAMVVTKKVYAGIGVGFAIWLVEVISMGQITKRWTLFTVYIPEDASFVVNRLGLVIVSLIVIIISIFWANKREKWIINDDSQ